MKQIIDAHAHYITSGMIEDNIKRVQKSFPMRAEAVMASGGAISNIAFLNFLKKSKPEDVAHRWLADMDKAGLEKVIFFPISERVDELKEFVDISPKRFFGYAYIQNPIAEDAPAKLRHQVGQLGFVGLKLYPCLQMFHAWDERLFPLYEMAEQLQLPVTFHMGITNAPAADYRYTNPLDLQLPLKLFPKLNFIVAHFGAGMLREVCLLAYENKNLFLDSSGTNSWLNYLPEKLTLAEVFTQTIKIFGARNILFGTDTVMKPREGYRLKILQQQTEIVNSILPPEEAALIMGGNAKRLYKL